MIKLLDTFAGVGWFHLALEKSIWKENIECVWFSEIDKFAKSVYQKHFPNTPDLGDITKIDIDNLPDFDLLTGWFPCQDVSVAWKQNLEWGRTILVEYLLQILEKKQPKYFIFENVKGLMWKKFEVFFNSIHTRIIEAWYAVGFKVLNTKDFWIPQNRERVFMVWFLNQSEILDFSFPKWEELKVFLKDILEDEVEDKFYMNNIQIAWVDKSNYRERKPYNINSDYIWTIKVWWDVKRIKNWDIRRYLTPTEYERLQGFPDNWTSLCSNTQRYKQMWNAITVEVVKRIFDNLINEI